MGFSASKYVVTYMRYSQPHLRDTTQSFLFLEDGGMSKTEKLLLRQSKTF